MRGVTSSERTRIARADLSQMASNHEMDNSFTKSKVSTEDNQNDLSSQVNGQGPKSIRTEKYDPIVNR